MKFKTVEDDTPGVDRCAIVNTSMVDARSIQNNIVRHPDGRVEKLPSLCGPTTAGYGDIGIREAYMVSDRARSWYAMVCDRAGNVCAFTLTNARAELTSPIPWTRRPYEQLRRHKIRVTGGFYWTGDCLVKQIRDSAILERHLMTRQDLPAVECEPNPDGPCPCKERERDARQARHTAKEREAEEKFAAKDRARDLELSMRSAEALAEVLAPVLERLAPESKGKKRG